MYSLEWIKEVRGIKKLKESLESFLQFKVLSRKSVKTPDKIFYNNLLASCDEAIVLRTTHQLLSLCTYIARLPGHKH